MIDVIKYIIYNKDAVYQVNNAQGEDLVESSPGFLGFPWQVLPDLLLPCISPMQGGGPPYIDTR